MATRKAARPTPRTPQPVAAEEPERLGVPALIGWAVIALLGLYALFLSGYWIISLAAPGMVASDWIYLLGVLAGCLACVTLVLGVPVFTRWRPADKVLIPLAIGLGICGLCAAAAVLPLGMLWACDTVCKPADTFRALPMIFACAALVAVGPGVMALNRRNLRWTGVSVVIAVVGFCVAMFLWVEWGLYPNS